MKKKVVIGLTGFYCSGKSEAENILKNQLNFQIIDVDKIGHWALEQNKNKLIKIFGSSILAGKNIDRKRLGNIVFNNSGKLQKLNSIVHPEMVKKVKAEITKGKKAQICINAALLFDMGLDKLCSKIIIVRSSFLKILLRAKKRDGSSFPRTIKILRLQKKLKRHKGRNVFYIKNNGSIKKLSDEILKAI